MSELVVETRSLAKHFAGLGQKPVTAVDGLNMHIERGSIYGFVGRNGAGKTTTIRMLAGLNAPTSGSARVLGLGPAARADRDSGTNWVCDRPDDDALYDGQ